MLPRPPRIFDAADVLYGKISLDGYPFRYVYVTVSEGAFNVNDLGLGGDRGKVDVLLSTVEFLETRGWELVTLDPRGRLAVVRRR